jgi:hypothetical protein
MTVQQQQRRPVAAGGRADRDAFADVGIEKATDFGAVRKTSDLNLGLSEHPCVEHRWGTGVVITGQLDATKHIARHVREVNPIEPSCVEAFIVCGERFPTSPVHAKHMIEVLSVIAVGMNYLAGNVHPGQSSGNRMDAGLFKHFSDGTVRRVLARLDDARDRGPSLVVGAFDQKHLLIANDHSGHARQPQWRMSDVPAKLGDEVGDRHNHLFSRDRDHPLSCARARSSSLSTDREFAVVRGGQKQL